MKKIFLILISIICINSGSAQKYTDTYLKDANNVAINWLKNINSKQYKIAYNLLAKDTKSNYVEEEWITFLNNLMIEFGNIKERTKKTSSFQSSVEGLEDGFYVTIEYASNYLNTINHEEYLLLKQNDKAKWEIVSFNYKFTKLDGSK